MTVRFSTSTFLDGPMGRNVALTEECAERREDFLHREFGSGLLRAASSVNAHGNHVVVVLEDQAGSLISDCDGLLTNTLHLPLHVGHQDCTPIVLWDVSVRICGVLHAGWRGCVAGILPSAIRLVNEHFGVAPTDIRIAIGPHLRPCHFEIQEDVAAQIRLEYPEAVIYRENKMFLDMTKILEAQARNICVTTDITINRECTFCTRDENGFKYTSWRRDANRESNMLTAVVLG